MTDARPLRFGIQAGPVDLPYAARCDLWQAADNMHSSAKQLKDQGIIR